MTTSTVEIPFAWTCPRCGHVQTNTCNPDLGPFFNINCEPCGPRLGTFEQHELSAKDAAAWEAAMKTAEATIA